LLAIKNTETDSLGTGPLHLVAFVKPLLYLDTTKSNLRHHEIALKTD
jgi:hypothetical protein